MQATLPASAAVATPVAQERGILITGSHIPLTLVACEISADVAGEVANVHVRMTYLNETNKDVSVVASVASPAGWTIVGCDAAYDGGSMHSRFVAVQESEKANSEDTNVIVIPTSSSTGTAVVDLPFTVAVGTSITVGTTYLVPLCDFTTVTPQAGRFVFTLPAGLVPLVRRPAPTTASYNAVYTLLNQAEHNGSLQLRVRASLPCPLRGEVCVETANPINQLEAIPLERQVAYNGDSAFDVTCTLPLPEASSVAAASSSAVNGQYCGGPLTICCDTQDTIEPLRIFVEAPSEEGGSGLTPAAVAATLTVTGLEAKVGDVVNSEFIFVVDSHHAVTSEAAGRALAIALRALPGTVHVNVVVLTSDGHRVVYPAGSAPVQQVELEPLRALITELNPQKVGVDDSSRLFEALELLLPQRLRSVELLPRIPGYVRHIVVLSDGAAVSTSAASGSIVALAHRVAAARGDARVSAVAVTAATTSADHHTAAGLALLETLSRRGGGYFVEASQPAATPTAVVSLLAAAAVPTLTDLRVAFVEGDVRPALDAHSPLPVVPAGCAHTVYGLAPPATTAVSVHATAKVGIQVVEFMGSSSSESVSVSACGEFQRPPLLQAAAQARVHAILAAGAPSADTAAEIVELSEVVGVPSPLTRLVLCRDGNTAAGVEPLAVEPAATFAAAAAIAESAGCLVQLEGLRRQWVAVLASRLAAPGDDPAETAGSAASSPTRLAPSSWASTVETFVRAIVAQEAEAPSQLPPSLERLLELQERDGSFPPSAAVASATGVSVDSLEVTEPLSEVVSAKEQMNAIKMTLWSTVVAVCFMEQQAQPVAALALRASVALLNRKSPSGEWRSWLGEAQDLLNGAIPA